jgi:hypothetical protein
LSDFLRGNVDLGCYKLLQAVSFLFLYFKKFYFKPMFQDPWDFGGSNGNGSVVFRTIQMHGGVISTFDFPMDDHFTASYPEVVCDSHLGMIA